MDNNHTHIGTGLFLNATSWILTGMSFIIEHPNVLSVFGSLTVSTMTFIYYRNLNKKLKK